MIRISVKRLPLMLGVLSFALLRRFVKSLRVESSLRHECTSVLDGGFCQAPAKLDFDDNDLARETKPLCEFIADLDDALLESLKEIWALSADRESFDCVYTDFDSPSYRATVGALSPQEQKDLGGIRPKEHWYREPTESKEWFLYNGKMPRWDCGEQDHYDSEWRWEGFDGPIILWLEYSILVDDDTGRSIGYGLEIFRRARQFCLDARQKSEAHIGRLQHQAFHEVARHHPPPEIWNNILSYIKYSDPFPYLEKLDLAEAYVPFRKVGEHCACCDHIEGESTAQRTCPQKAIHAWNLALRRFHTFNKTNCHAWALCARYDCQGHHDDEEDWEVEKIQVLSPISSL